MAQAIEFLNAWKKASTEAEEGMLECWEQSKLFTSLVLNKSECLLVAVGAELGLKVYPYNYYSLDGILYSDSDLVPDCPPDQRWFRSLAVAFEHENSFGRNVYQEIAHLLLIRARLSVIVSYSDSYHEKWMSYFHSIIAGCEHADDLDAKESFLMILGRRNPLRWDGYVFKHSDWKLLA